MLTNIITSINCIGYFIDKIMNIKRFIYIMKSIYYKLIVYQDRIFREFFMLE